MVVTVTVVQISEAVVIIVVQIQTAGIRIRVRVVNLGWWGGSVCLLVLLFHLSVVFLPCGIVFGEREEEALTSPNLFFLSDSETRQHL